MGPEWPLLTGGRYSGVVVRTGLTIFIKNFLFAIFERNAGILLFFILSSKAYFPSAVHMYYQHLRQNDVFIVFIVFGFFSFFIFIVFIVCFYFHFLF